MFAPPNSNIEQDQEMQPLIKQQSTLVANEGTFFKPATKGSLGFALALALADFILYQTGKVSFTEKRSGNTPFFAFTFFALMSVAFALFTHLMTRDGQNNNPVAERKGPQV